MRDEKEERKKQARSNKQTRQSNTAHPRQSLFLEKMSCPGGTLYMPFTLYMYNVYVQNPGFSLRLPKIFYLKVSL